MRQQSIPRSSLVWILAAALSSLVWHVVHLPIWMWLLVAFAFGWRWLTHIGRLPYPNKIVKTMAVVAATAAVILSFGKQFSLESAAAFLVAACVLKLLEMKNQRDGHVVIFLSYVLLAIGFLFEQGIGAGLSGILIVWLITTALVALHRNRSDEKTSDKVFNSSVRMSGSILLVSLPLMLVMYLVFPRFGPLWSVALQSDQARTGLSDSMSPGDIANLSQSDELAFRVSFKDDKPLASNQLYWRALILDSYNGRTWESRGFQGVQWAPGSWQPPEGQEGVVEYEIIQEPTDNKWLFALRGVAAIENGTGMTGDDLLLHRREVYQRIRYDVKSWLDVSLDENSIRQQERWQYTQLPKNSNPRARAWAEKLRRESNSDEEFIGKIWGHFRQQQYYYTLKPPALGDNDIDAFLFDTQRGFCAHYSGAMTFLARAVGIPARIVAGYQGGEWNEEEKYLSVRQYDAHAWIEVWYAGKGWTRVDPTAAVSPARIEFGLEAAMKEEGTFLDDQLFSTHKLKSIGWLNNIRLRMDSLNYYWQSWVLSYDNKRQKDLLNGVLGIKSYESLLYTLAMSFAGFFLIAAAVLWWNQRPKASSAFMLAWQKLQDKAERLGVEGEVGETPSHYLQRLARNFPKHRVVLQWLDGRLQHYLYIAPASSDKKVQKQAEKDIIRSIHKVKRQLK